MADEHGTAGEAGQEQGAAGADAGSAAGGQQEGAWYDNFAEDIRSDPSVQKFESPEQLAKGYINMQHILGRDKIPIPKTDEEFSDAFKILGRPDNAAEYEFKPAEGEDDGWFREIAHAANLTNNQFSAISDSVSKIIAEGQQAQETETKLKQDELNASLQKEWGSAYDRQVSLAQAAVKEYADDDLISYLDESGLGDDPRLLKVFAKIGAATTEQPLEGGEQNGFTSQELDAAISSVQSHPAYFDGDHPEHGAYVNKMRKLMAQKAA